MSEWMKIKISDALYVQGGYAFQSKDYSETGVKLIRISNVGKGKMDPKSQAFLSEKNYSESTDFQLKEGNILMGLTGDLGKVCKINKCDLPALLNQRVGRFKLNNGYDNDYFYYLFSSPFIQNQLALLFTGGAQANISPKQIHSLEVAVPKDEIEQSQIAKILSNLDKAIVSTEQLIAKYQRIKTGLLQDLLTNGIDKNGNLRSEKTHKYKDSPLGRIPVEWDYKRLGETYTDMKSGSTPLRKNKAYFEDGIYLWVKTLDLNEDEIHNTQEKITKTAIEESSCSLFPIDSVLIAMYGGWEQIGRTAILKKEATTNQAITALFNPKIELSSEYTQFFLQHFRYKWKSYAVSTRKDPNITKTDIQNFIITYPNDYDEQLNIVKAIQNSKKTIQNYQNYLSKLQSLKTGLMQDLLSGKVRVK